MDSLTDMPAVRARSKRVCGAPMLNLAHTRSVCFFNRLPRVVLGFVAGPLHLELRHALRGALRDNFLGFVHVLACAAPSKADCGVRLFVPDVITVSNSRHFI